MFPPDFVITWKHLIYDVSEVVDNVEHCVFSQIFIINMWSVITEK